VASRRGAAGSGDDAGPHGSRPDRVLARLDLLVSGAAVTVLVVAGDGSTEGQRGSSAAMTTGRRTVCKQAVVGSNPIVSTTCDQGVNW
jgi:hypothetical protein